MIDFVSNTDELEHRMDIEDARLGVVEEMGFQVELLGSGWLSCVLGRWGHDVQLLIRRPLNSRKSASFKVTSISSLTRAIAAICPSTKDGVRPAATSRARSTACQSAARRS